MSASQVNRKSPAFERKLYDLHYKRIYSTCLRIIGNTMDAEEAMHDTFLKIFAHINNLRDQKAFYSWSQHIAVRTSIDRVRKKHPIVFGQVDGLLIAEEESTDEEEFIIKIDAIKKEINNLPDGYRIIISMRLFEEYEFEEIASMLHIKESTVRSQFTRGRTKLIRQIRDKNKIEKEQINYLQ